MTDQVQNEIARAINTTLGAPLSETSQLIADKVRFLRWKSAIRTLERAREFASSHGGLKSCPPLKFFLPFMESCSLEEPNSDLVDGWARLLNSAATDFQPNHLIFSRILKEISSREAKVLAKICRNETIYEDIHAMDSIFESIGQFSSMPTEDVKEKIRDVTNYKIRKEEFLTMSDDIINSIQGLFSAPGSSIYQFEIYDVKIKLMSEFSPILKFGDGFYDEYGEENALFASDVLAYHRLVDFKTYRFELESILKDAPLSVFFVGASVTSLGAFFWQSCMNELNENRVG